MVAAQPNDFELYRLLVEVYRQSGNATEAGRWGYLTGDANPDEIAAFEHAHPRPAIRLRLIGWTGDPELLPDDEARQRLAALVGLARDETTVPITVRVPMARLSADRKAAVPRQRGERVERQPSVRPGSLSRPRQPRPGVRPRSVSASMRNFTTLVLFIVFGLGGSVAAVAGVLALLGVPGWMAPVQDILDALDRAISQL